MQMSKMRTKKCSCATEPESSGDKVGLIRGRDGVMMTDEIFLFCSARLDWAQDTVLSESIEPPKLIPSELGRSHPECGDVRAVPYPISLCY